MFFLQHTTGPFMSFPFYKFMNQRHHENFDKSHYAKLKLRGGNAGAAQPTPHQETSSQSKLVRLGKASASGVGELGL
jgi:hypothetical protein